MQRRSFRSMGILLCCALSALPLASQAASAPQALQVGSEFATRTVGYRTLNLARDEGVARLYSRIRSAADAVCTTSSAEQLRLSERRRRCEAAAIANAVAEVNLPALTLLHEGKARIVVAQH
jgi:UrcA family protein